MTRKRGKPAAEESLSTVVQPESKHARLEAMAKAANKLSFKPAAQVLTRVSAVPTIFPQFDMGSRVGGLPLQRYTLLHGESAHGKTTFALGLELSFLQRNHFVLHVDAELTTPISWIEKLMGEYATHPGFFALRSCIFERVADATRQFCDMVAAARAKGTVSPDTGGLVVLDSWGKLVPDKVREKLEKMGAGKAGVDGMGGRLGQMQAATNAQWLKEVVPMLYETNCALVGIAREGEDPDASATDRMYGRDFKIRGGKDVVYDSSMSNRIIRAKYVTQGSDDEKDVIGERHLVRIWRSKVAGHDDKETDCYFHTSNGKLTPEGFDRARDVLEIARDMGIVKTEGSWLHWGNRKWQGENQAVRKLTDAPEALVELEAKVRAGFVVEGQPPEAA